jgi:hypothetical protein
VGQIRELIRREASLGELPTEGSAIVTTNDVVSNRGEFIHHSVASVSTRKLPPGIGQYLQREPATMTPA